MKNLTDFRKTVEISMDLRDFKRQERICTSVKHNAELLSGKQR